MNLSNELISQFVKATKDNTKTSVEATVNGTVVEYGGKTYVKLDGSDLLTPVRTTTDVKNDERVTVMIKDHTATITGNMSSPAARTDAVKDVADQITEFEIVVAHKVKAEEIEAINAVIENLRAEMISVGKIDAVLADIETLEAKFANVEYLNATEIKAISAVIDNLEAQVGKFSDLSTDSLSAITAHINRLKGYTAEFTYLSTEQLEAIKAQIKELDANKITTEQLDAKYAEIDFANIGEAAIEKLFSDSGIIKDIVVSDGQITGELHGVTIRGDLITAGTLKADRLIVKGSNGLYYTLNIEAGAVASAEVSEEELQNGLHGTAIIAKTITANKIAVDDLVAFDATIGGFNISEDSIYSVGKGSASSNNTGVYLGRDGQMAVGDSDNFLKYYKDSDGKYKLDISASSLVFSAKDGKTIDDVIGESVENISVGARNLLQKTDATKWFSEWTKIGTNAGVNAELMENGWVKISSSGNGLEYAISTPKVSTIDEPGEYTLSFDAYSDDVPYINRMYLRFGDPDNKYENDYKYINKRVDITNESSRYSFQFNISDKHVQVGMMIGTIVGSSFYVRNIKLEKGNKATDWSPAPEDIYQSLTGYYTKEETDSKISQTSESINLTVNQKVQTAVDNISVGARNILQKTDATKWFGEYAVLGSSNGAKAELAGNGWIKASTTGSGWEYGICTPKVSIIDEPGEYTLSFDAYSTSASYINRMYLRFGDPDNIYENDYTFIDKRINITTTPARYAFQFAIASAHVQCGMIIGTISGSDFYVRNIKLEKGNKATEWTPAPEDVDQTFAGYYTKEETEAALKLKADSVDLSVTQQRIEEVNSSVSKTLENYYTKDETADTIDKIKIGTRNILQKTDATKWYDEWILMGSSSGAVAELTDNGWVRVTRTGSTAEYGIATPKASTVDEPGEYMLSFDAYSPDAQYLNRMYIKFGDPDNLYEHDYKRIDKRIDITTEPTRYSFPLTLDTSYVDLGVIIGTVAGTNFYVRNIKLEKGNKATEWTPAPEEFALYEDVITVIDSVTNLSVKTNEILASVNEVTTTTTKSLSDINSEITSLSKSVSAQMTSEQVDIRIKSAIDDGTSKVITSENGFTFDDSGLNISRTGSEMKTQITDNGMTVFQNDVATLTANNAGVVARDLHASTYLIVGGRSRFENYGSNRTGCFWIGG